MSFMAISASGLGAGGGYVDRAHADGDALVDNGGSVGGRVLRLGANVPDAVRAQRVVTRRAGDTEGPLGDLNRAAAIVLERQIETRILDCLGLDARRGRGQRH